MSVIEMNPLLAPVEAGGSSPESSGETARALLNRHWHLDEEAVDVGSLQDQNFQIVCGDGRRFVLMKRVGEIPAQICHEWNNAIHVDVSEGRPERRPLTRVELQVLFDVADERVVEIGRSGRKGWLAAFRDATRVHAVHPPGLPLTCDPPGGTGILGLTPRASHPAVTGSARRGWGQACWALAWATQP